MTYAPDVDATDLDVAVANNEVTLRGTVTREEKRRAEDIVEDILGVKDVRNEIRVSSGDFRGGTGLNLTGCEMTPSPVGEQPRSPRPRI